MSTTTHAEQRTRLEERGYVEVPEARVVDGTVVVGDRVRNRGEQYVKAYWHGTARVVAIYEKPDSSWSRTYNMPDVEVITQRDRDPEGTCPMPWANYGTVVRDDTLSWCVLADDHDGPCRQDDASPDHHDTACACLDCLDAQAQDDAEALSQDERSDLRRHRGRDRGHRMTTCDEETTRRGEVQPCDKPAVAMRLDPTEGTPYPVCAYHTRGPMLTLAELRARLDDERSD